MSYTTWNSNSSMSDAAMTELVVIMEGFIMEFVGMIEQVSQRLETCASCFTQDWHLDSDLLEPSQIRDLVYNRKLKSKDDEPVLDKLEFVCLVYIHRILTWFESAEGKTHAPHSGFWKSYVEWTHTIEQQFPPLPADVEFDMQAARKRTIKSESGDIMVQTVDRIGQNFSRILTHEVEALQCMNEGEILYPFFQREIGTSFNTNVAEYVGLIADKQPRLRILEIGAGTGGTTDHVLERLHNPDGSSKAAQ
jgi:hypothetical protein